MKKIFICGSVTGDPDYRDKFKKEERRLFALNYEPVSPPSFIPKNTEWTKAMKLTLRALLLCDGVSLLPDWKKSKGSKIEEQLARDLGIEVRKNEDWN